MTKMMQLKQARVYHGMTLRDVAAALRMPVVEYWIYEQEPGEIPVDDLMRLAELYGCSVDDLMLERHGVGDILEVINATEARSA